MTRIRDFVSAASIIALAGAFMIAPGPVWAASISNTDDVTWTVKVTEGGDRFELVLLPGEGMAFCLNGCFIVYPDGDRSALEGDESVVITSGRGRIEGEG